jgi:hypothetical protein
MPEHTHTQTDKRLLTGVGSAVGEGVVGSGVGSGVGDCNRKVS